MRTKPFEKLEVGKTYLTRNGEPVEIKEETGDPIYPFEGVSLKSPYLGTVGSDSWTPRGQYQSYEDNHRWDLVGEVIPDGKIIIGHGYKTRGGLEASVAATDAPDKEYPIIGYVITSTGHCEAAHWTEKGEWVAGKESPRDLVLEVPVLTVREAAEALLASHCFLLSEVGADPDVQTEVKNLRAALTNEQP